MQTSVQVAEISGDDTVAMNLEQAMEKVQNFKKTVNSNPNPSIMSFGLQPYSTASFKDENGKIQLVDTNVLPLRAKAYSPVYDIPFSESPEFFTRYQANALSSVEVANFMSEVLKKRSGTSGASTGGWGIKSCFTK